MDDEAFRKSLRFWHIPVLIWYGTKVLWAEASEDPREVAGVVRDLPMWVIRCMLLTDASKRARGLESSFEESTIEICKIERDLRAVLSAKSSE